MESGDEQVNLAKTLLLENANMGDLGVLQIAPTHRIKGNPIAYSAAHENSVDAITVDPTSDKLFATGSHDKTIKLWDANKPQKALNTLTGNKNGVWCLNYAHDGKRLLSASSEGLCKIWDVKSGKVMQELTGHVGAKVSLLSYLRRLITHLGTKTQQWWRLAEATWLSVLTTCARAQFRSSGTKSLSRWSDRANLQTTRSTSSRLPSMGYST
jgi:WD40 repeat protein